MDGWMMDGWMDGIIRAWWIESLDLSRTTPEQKLDLRQRMALTLRNWCIDEARTS